MRFYGNFKSCRSATTSKHLNLSCNAPPYPRLEFSSDRIKSDGCLADATQGLVVQQDAICVVSVQTLSEEAELTRATCCAWIANERGLLEAVCQRANHSVGREFTVLAESKC